MQAALKLQEVKKVREFVQSTSQKTPQPKVTKPKAIKRTQVESSVSSTTPAPPMMMMESKKFRTGLPLNFYEIVGPLFQEFWRMKFSNEVNCAFFAKITINNCREYGLDAFAQHSSSLPTIKVNKNLKNQQLFYSTIYYLFCVCFCFCNRRNCRIERICQWKILRMISINFVPMCSNIIQKNMKQGK